MGVCKNANLTVGRIVREPHFGHQERVDVNFMIRPRSCIAVHNAP